MPRQREQPKVQRWTDLLAALLRCHYPVAFDELKRDVPAYASHNGNGDALMRMFERDKDELRSLGVPIETLPDEQNNHSRYRLASKSFYLPYLTLANERAGSRQPKQPKRPRGPGYQALPKLAFEPDELDMVIRAGRRVQQLGDPELAANAASALRKLAHDLPDAQVKQDELIATDDVLGADVFAEVSKAIRARKRLRFTYRSMHPNGIADREVEPYGAAYVSSHWYLVGRDLYSKALRQFRMTRMRAVRANAQAPRSPDFDVPVDFDLWTHTASKHAWELGDADVVRVVVRFDSAMGARAAREGLALG